MKERDGDNDRMVYGVFDRIEGFYFVQQRIMGLYLIDVQDSENIAKKSINGVKNLL